MTRKTQGMSQLSIGHYALKFTPFLIAGRAKKISRPPFGVLSGRPRRCVLLIWGSLKETNSLEAHGLIHAIDFPPSPRHRKALASGGDDPNWIAGGRAPSPA